MIGYSYARGGTEVGLFEIVARGRAALPRDLPPALERLLLVAQLREPPHRQQAGVLHAALPQSLARRPVRAVPGDAQWRPARRSRLQAHRAGDAHLPHRRRARPVAGRRAAHGHGLRPRQAASSTARAPRCWARRARVLRVAELGLRVGHEWRRGGAGSRLQPVPHPARRLRRRARSRRAGRPIDQFSFLEGDDGHLNVLVRVDGRGDGMWAAESTPATSRCCACRSRASPTAATAHRASSLPALARARRATRCRTASSATTFSTAQARAGTGRRRRRSRSSTRCAMQAGDTHRVSLAHGVDRIEALGSDAVLVGSDGSDLHFTSLRLGAMPAAVGSLHAQGRGAGRDAQPRLLLQARSRRRRPARPADHRRGESAGAPAAAGIGGACSSCATSGLSFTELGALDARPARQDATTAAAPPASTGTATRGRSSSAAACSR